MTRIKVESQVGGTVWKIEAAPGATLAADDTILIVESMKMEIALTTPQAGRLVEIHVQEGEVIESGQVVAIVER